MDSKASAMGENHFQTLVEQPKHRKGEHSPRNGTSKQDTTMDTTWKNHQQILKLKQSSGLIQFGYSNGQFERNNVQQRINTHKEDARWYDVFWSVVEKFSEKTSIHGINHMFARGTGKQKRLLWFFAFLCALLLLIFVSLEVAARYNNQQFETVIDDPKYPVFKIPFPEVTICNENRLNWSRLPEAKQRFLMPSHQSGLYEQLFTEVVAIFDTLTLGELSKFKVLAGRPLAPLNYVNFTEVVNFMAWRCDEILADCSWGLKKYDCCEIFLPRISQYGRCLAFNTIESDMGKIKELLDPYWPWRTSRTGRGRGLSLRVYLHEKQHSPMSNNAKGVSYMIAEQHVWFTPSTFVAAHMQASLSIDAVYRYYDNETRGVPSNIRQCVFENEQGSLDFKTFKGHKYMFENCQSVCQQKYLVDICNCTMDLFFPSDSYPVCKLVDLPCLANNNENLFYYAQIGEAEYMRPDIIGIECHCFYNCYSLSYIKDLRSIALPEEDLVINNSYVDMDFYFKRSHIFLYRTSLIYTWVDLMVSFGGIAGLFLGCSLISIMELVYFFFVDVPTWLWQECRRIRNTKWRSRKIEQNVKMLLVQENERRLR